MLLRACRGGLQWCTIDAYVLNHIVEARFVHRIPGVLFPIQIPNQAYLASGEFLIIQVRRYLRTNPYPSLSKSYAGGKLAGKEGTSHGFPRAATPAQTGGCWTFVAVLT